MAEDVDSEIAAALAKLAQRDAGSVGNAEAALEWIVGELGLAAITQEHVQNFCWYQLPMKWLISHEEKLRVAVALGEVLDLLQLPRYASICRSQATREILGAYEESSRLGKAAFHRAAADSGITPPDLPDSSRTRAGSGGISTARRGPRTTCTTCTRCAGSPRSLDWRAGPAVS